MEYQSRSKFKVSKLKNLLLQQHHPLPALLYCTVLGGFETFENRLVVPLGMIRHLLSRYRTRCDWLCSRNASLLIGLHMAFHCVFTGGSLMLELFRYQNWRTDQIKLNRIFCLIHVRHFKKCGDILLSFKSMVATSLMLRFSQDMQFTLELIV